MHLQNIVTAFTLSLATAKPLQNADSQQPLSPQLLLPLSISEPLKQIPSVLHAQGINAANMAASLASDTFSHAASHLSVLADMSSDFLKDPKSKSLALGTSFMPSELGPHFKHALEEDDVDVFSEKADPVESETVKEEKKKKVRRHFKTKQSAPHSFPKRHDEVKKDL